MKRILNNWRQILLAVVLIVAIPTIIISAFMLRGKPKTETGDNEKISKNIERISNYADEIDVPENAVSEYQDVYGEAVGKFASATAEKFISGTQNTCYSPISMYTALGLTAEMTTGNTQKEILEVLGVDSLEQIDDYLNVYKEIVEDNKYADRKAVLCNSLWVRKAYASIDSSSDADEKMQELFDGNIFIKNFDTEDVNKWVKEKTEGLVTEILPNGSPCTVALINTLYYTSQWNESFELCGVGDFKLQSGEKITTEYMRWNSEQSDFIKGVDYTAVTVQAGSSKMIFVSPDEGIDLETIVKEDVISEITASSSIMGRDRLANVTLWAPLFKYDYSLSGDDIRKIFKEMGIRKLYENPEFSGIIESLEDNIYMAQSTKISVDENGIEAATASGVYATSGKREYSIKLMLDRPFMYILVEDGVPLYIGTVYNPTEG